MSTEGSAGGAAERQDLNELVKSLKETLMELRGVLDELTNPVVPPPGIEARKAMARQAAAAPSPAPGEEKREGAVAEAAGAPPTVRPVKVEEAAVSPRAEVPARRREERVLEVVSRLREVPETGKRELGLERLAGLLRLVYELQARVPPEYLGGLADILFKSGLIDEAQRDTLKRIIDLARIGYESGLSVEESIAILAALAKELGLDVTAITEELVKAVLRRRGGEQWESRQQ